MKKNIYILFTSFVIVSILSIVVFVYFPNSSKAGTISTISCDIASSRNLKLGSYGVPVRELQKVLNMSFDTQVSSSGPGSPGNESTYFGIITKNAVIKFQEKYASEILAPYGLTHGSGRVGNDTRAMILKICQDGIVSPTPNTHVNTISSQNQTSSARNAYNSYTNNTRNKRRKTPPPTSTTTPPMATTTPPVATTTPPLLPPVTSTGLQWGAYVGANATDLTIFETLVAKPVNIQAIFVAFTDGFPLQYSATVGAKGKTLLIFWEPTVNYDSINNGGQDVAIMKFAVDAMAYKYPIILAPFHEMNLNEGIWGYGVNGNNANKFKLAWIRVHNMLASVPNIKFAIAFNNDSVPDVAGNKIADYYPGDAYVDYVGVDGFNFGNPWQGFASVFDSSMATVGNYGKPVYIFSVASSQGSLKASWIKDGLGSRVNTYKNIAGWVWFNQNKEQDWRVNSDQASLDAFKGVVSGL